MMVSFTVCGIFQPIASRNETRVTGMSTSRHLEIMRSSRPILFSKSKLPSKLEPKGLPKAMEPASAPASAADRTVLSRLEICSA